MIPRIVTLFALTALLAGCGTNPVDRVISGAAIGAGSGIVGAAIVGGSIVTGAAAGIAVGAIIGGVTQASDFDLGEPFWD